MSKEKRNYYRSNFKTKKTDNVIYIKREHAVAPISRLFDLSNYGLGIQCEQELKRETPVIIELKAFELHLSVKGTVRWCKPIENHKNLYRMGIEFDSTQSQDNKLFSFALRRHLEKAS